jgi:hypothetical protein
MSYYNSLDTVVAQRSLSDVLLDQYVQRWLMSLCTGFSARIAISLLILATTTRTLAQIIVLIH